MSVLETMQKNNTNESNFYVQLPGDRETVGDGGISVVTKPLVCGETERDDAREGKETRLLEETAQFFFSPSPSGLDSAFSALPEVPFFS